MEFFRIKRVIPFMRYGRITTLISAVTFALAVASLGLRGLNFSIDFTGGTELQVHYTHAADVQQARTLLEGHGYRDVSVQNFGTPQDLIISVRQQKQSSPSEVAQAVLRVLQTADPSASLGSSDFVGPKVGKELYNNGGLALLMVCGGIMAYLAIRFEWRFAIAAIVANLHDVVIILGFFSFFQWEFSLPVLAAVLAVLGYSVNESVVVFDRIRENFRKMRKATVPQIIDNAITATMSRTVITHTMTQLMVLSMLLFGGTTLFYFSVALTIGIVFSIYSSVLVASPIVMWLGVARENLMPVKREGEKVDLRP